MVASILAFAVAAHSPHTVYQHSAVNIDMGVILQFAIVALVLFIAYKILQALIEAIGHILAAVVAFLSALALLYLLARVYSFAAGYVSIINLPQHHGILRWILELGNAIFEWFKNFIINYIGINNIH